MLHSFLGKRTQADQEAWEASITTRQDQDEVVSRLDDQLREAKERMPTSSSQPRPSWSSNYQLSKAN